MKKDAYYFPHYSNARNDCKLLKVRRVLGLEGYAIYFMLLEVLRDQTNFKYPINGIEDLAYEWHTSKEKIFSIINDFDLFNVEQNLFFSSKLIFFLQPYLEKSIKARESANKRWNNTNERNANALQTQCERITNAISTQCEVNADVLLSQSVGNASKVKEKRVNKENNIDFSFLDFLKSDKEKFISLIEKFIDYRKKIKKPLKEASIEAFSKKLLSLSNNNFEIAEKIINESISNGWQGIFGFKNSQLQESKNEIKSTELIDAMEYKFYGGLSKYCRIEDWHKVRAIYDFEIDGIKDSQIIFENRCKINPEKLSKVF